MERKIDKYIKLTDEHMADIEKTLDNAFITLKQYGVAMPIATSLKKKWLIYLYAFQGIPVHKNVITQFCHEFSPNCSSDQQVRHLAADGWFVLKNGEEYNNIKCPRGYYCLVSIEQPNPHFLVKKDFRKENLTISDFEGIKQLYKYTCATCGGKENTEHRYGFGKISLQKGHRDPNKPLEIGNIIPQCQFCNRDMYKDNFVFDEFGRPTAVNNPTYILRSTKQVKQAMLKLLQDELGEE